MNVCYKRIASVTKPDSRYNLQQHNYYNRTVKKCNYLLYIIQRYNYTLKRIVTNSFEKNNAKYML